MCGIGETDLDQEDEVCLYSAPAGRLLVKRDEHSILRSARVPKAVVVVDINAAHRGTKVIGVDSNKYRARLAMELGAKAIVDPKDPDALKQIKGLTGGRGVDKAIDCTGVPAAQKFAIEPTRRRGHVAFVGWGSKIELDNMVPNGLTLQGIWHWNLTLAPRMMQLIREVGPQLDKVITHKYPMGRVKDAWEQQLTGETGKVFLYPWQ